MASDQDTRDEKKGVTWGRVDKETCSHMGEHGRLNEEVMTNLLGMGRVGGRRVLEGSNMNFYRAHRHLHFLFLIGQADLIW